jgi:hypothetical protein
LEKVRNKKPNFTYCDFNDVTFGSSAIFFVQNLKETAEKTGRRSQMKLSETRGFPSPPHDGFGFVGAQVRLPQAEASGRQKSRYSGEAHFIISSEKRWSEPGLDGNNFRLPLNDNFLKVKNFLLRYPDDYKHKISKK